MNVCCCWFNQPTDDGLIYSVCLIQVKRTIYISWNYWWYVKAWPYHFIFIFFFVPCFYFFFLLHFCALHTHCLEFYFDFSIRLFKIVALGITLYIHNLLQCTSVEIWRRQWHPTPVLLPGKSHGWGSLVGCSPWGRWESNLTERLHFHFSLSCIGEGNGNLLQCSCLENPKHREAWQASVRGHKESEMTE